MHSRDNKHAFNSTKDFLPRHYLSLRSKLFLGFLSCTRVLKKFIGNPKIIIMMMMVSKNQVEIHSRFTLWSPFSFVHSVVFFKLNFIKTQKGN